MGKSWKLIKDRLWKQTCYDNDDKYIKPKIKIYVNMSVWLQIFIVKKY